MFDHILVPLDGSLLAECVLSHAVAIAQTFGGRVTLLRVVVPAHTTGAYGFVDPVDWQITRAEAEAYLARVTARLRDVGLEAESVILEGQAAESILEFAHGNEIELIILSSHGGSGLSGWNISSVVQKIILRAYMPIMLVRAYHPTTDELTGMRYRRLLVPLDCSQRGECGLSMATTLAGSHGSELLLAHVVCRPEMARQMPLTPEDIELADRITQRNRSAASGYLGQLRSRLPADVQTHLLTGDNVSATLHELVEQEEVDLVVLCAHGYSGGTKWPYGSVAISFIVYGTTPLLIVQELSPEELEPSQAEVIARGYKGH